MTVPVDRTRFKVISDTVITIRSGNDSGVFRTRNKWYPVNKNLNYGDEEIGNQMFSSYKSTTVNQVLEIFMCMILLPV